MASLRLKCQLPLPAICRILMLLQTKTKSLSRSWGLGLSEGLCEPQLIRPMAPKHKDVLDLWFWPDLSIQLCSLPFKQHTSSLGERMAFDQSGILSLDKSGGDQLYTPISDSPMCDPRHAEPDCRHCPIRDKATASCRRFSQPRAHFQPATSSPHSLLFHNRGDRCLQMTALQRSGRMSEVVC